MACLLSIALLSFTPCGPALPCVPGCGIEPRSLQGVDRVRSDGTVFAAGVPRGSEQLAQGPAGIGRPVAVQSPCELGRRRMASSETTRAAETSDPTTQRAHGTNDLSEDTRANILSGSSSYSEWRSALHGELNGHGSEQLVCTGQICPRNLGLGPNKLSGIRTEIASNCVSAAAGASECEGERSFRCPANIG